MKYRTKYICPSCEVECLYIKMDMLPKELVASTLSGFNITKELLIDSIKGRGNKAIPKEIIEKSRLGDKYNSLYCIYCDEHFSFSKVV